MGNPDIKREPLSILLVEDNEDHAELVMVSFSHYRIANRVHHVTNGEDALNYMFRYNEYSDIRTSPRPHVVLLDLRLPRIDGFEVLEKIKACNELRHIPVVILTTSSVDTDIVKAYENHANSYLVKPVNFDKFTQLMDALGLYWLGLNRLPMEQI